MTKNVNRQEILFVYAVKDGNPNGDPANENMPRFDYTTQTVFVSDARIKRTVRDHLLRTGQNILISRDVRFSKNKISFDSKKKDIEITENNLKDFLDCRLFGAVPAGKTDTGELINLYGPVQFRFGHSLNKTEVSFMKGSSTPKRGEKDQTGKFTEKYFVPFVAIGTYGTVNELLAKNTELCQEDINLLYEGLWKGTEELQSSSKATHVPLILFVIEYKEPAMVGNLDSLLRLYSKDGKDITWNGDNAEKGMELRNVTEMAIGMENIKQNMLPLKEKVNKIKYIKNPILNIKEGKIENIFKDFKVEKINM